MYDKIIAEVIGTPERVSFLYPKGRKRKEARA
nr:MAG TPA: hypothetical protein [Caudoviricetes sp.]DAY61004.1 MAG TPA: hypothetical protein [Caudoviricetes sp.]